MQAAMTMQLVTNTLVMTIWRRRPTATLLHDLNQENQYTSEAF